MAKLCIKLRNEKRQKLVKRHAEKRGALVKILKSSDTSLDEKMKASEQLQKLPRDSSKVRIQNRCFITGRGRGVYRKFGLCRNKLREAAMRGDIPGLTKASW